MTFLYHFWAYWGFATNADRAMTGRRPGGPGPGSNKEFSLKFYGSSVSGTLSIHFPYTTHAEKGGVKRPNLAVLTER